MKYAVLLTGDFFTTTSRDQTTLYYFSNGYVINNIRYRSQVGQTPIRTNFRFVIFHLSVHLLAILKLIMDVYTRFKIIFETLCKILRLRTLTFTFDTIHHERCAVNGEIFPFYNQVNIMIRSKVMTTNKLMFPKN
jgi:hypothetical protein